MNYKKSDIQRYMMAHYRNMRQGVENPSKETLAMWRWQDAKDEFVLRMYEREEAAAAAKAAKEDVDTFHITSEVKIK